MADLQSQSSVGRGKITEVELTPNGFQVKRVCQDRFKPPAGPKDITLSVGKYIPFDQINFETYTGYNMTGWKLGSVTVKSRNVYPDAIGKRLVMEVGCNTVIYLQISPNNKRTHHRFYLQTHEGFVFDITTGAVAAKVSRAAEPIVTIAKYEMYFLMGMFSTVSVPMWIMITGTDVTLTLAGMKHKEKSFSKLGRTITGEMENIKKYAPTLHLKIMELISSENERLMSGMWKSLPKEVVTDEKAQAQTAGILYGKYTVSPGSVNAWGAILTVLIQAGVKSVSNLPDAYIGSLDARYASKLRALSNTNWYDIAERKRAVIQIVELLKEAKIKMTVAELEKIITEVQKNPDKLQQSFINILDAYKEFKREVN